MLNYVNLILDLYDGSGNPITQGAVAFTPTVLVTDTTDHLTMPPAPVRVQLFNNPTPTVRLLATDNAAPAPAGWAWQIAGTYPGTPPAQQYLIAYADGATQYLSGLIPATSAPAVYVPILVTGTPGAGQVITATSATTADWENPESGFTNPMTTAGDLITGGSAGAAGRLPAGASGQVLTVTSGAPAWQTPSAPVPTPTAANQVPVSNSSDVWTLSPVGTVGGNSYSGSWTVGTADIGGEGGYSSTSAGTATIPSGLTSTVGATVAFRQLSTGALTVGAGSGVTVEGVAVSTGQYQTLFARQVSVNVWAVTASQPASPSSASSVYLQRIFAV